MTFKYRIVIGGSSGRMGREVLALINLDKRFSFLGGINRRNKSDLKKLLHKADVFIDFSKPEATIKFAGACALARVPFITGTTGLNTQQTKQLKSFALKIPIFWSPNMSLGMNLLFSLAYRASKILHQYDAAISETHHTKKLDIPSGSAKILAQSIMRARKSQKKIPTVSIRAGNIIGEHTVLLAGAHERLELTHRAQSRQVFAKGAIDTAPWIHKRKPGFYTMADRIKI